MLDIDARSIFFENLLILGFDPQSRSPERLNLVSPDVKGRFFGHESKPNGESAISTPPRTRVEIGKTPEQPRRKSVRIVDEVQYLRISEEAPPPSLANRLEGDGFVGDDSLYRMEHSEGDESLLDEPGGAQYVIFDEEKPQFFGTPARDGFAISSISSPLLSISKRGVIFDIENREFDIGLLELEAEDEADHDDGYQGYYIGDQSADDVLDLANMGTFLEEGSSLFIDKMSILLEDGIEADKIEDAEEGSSFTLTSILKEDEVEEDKENLSGTAEDKQIQREVEDDKENQIEREKADTAFGCAPPAGQS
ncbi:hypothetical protein BJ742DRAFT_768847 [Cladochytrium replicatum]|nr:hypothetical protein BJ742DRAFT_768847 [Cladochytrium replicatum]